MEKAAFTLTNYQFEKVNIDLTQHTSNDLLLDFDPKGAYISQESVYELTFVVTIFVQGQTAPFVLVQCKGWFNFENLSSYEAIPDYFYRNAIAILFPYVRAYVSLVTTQANVPGVIIPTLNLSGLEGSLKNNTTQK